MDRSQAETIIRQALVISAEFEWSAAVYRRVAGDEEWPHYRRAVGQLIAEFYATIMRPIESVYPELSPLIYDTGQFDESQLPTTPVTREQLAARVREFASDAAECAQQFEDALGVSAAGARNAAAHVTAILASGT